MSKKSKKIKATSVLPMAVTGGFFIGLGLGALMGNALLVMAIGIVIGGVLGYSIDKKNGVSYGRRSH